MVQAHIKCGVVLNGVGQALIIVVHGGGHFLFGVHCAVAHISIEGAGQGE